jgi:hypothetical protein
MKQYKTHGVYDNNTPNGDVEYRRMGQTDNLFIKDGFVNVKKSLVLAKREPRHKISV